MTNVKKNGNDILLKEIMGHNSTAFVNRHILTNAILLKTLLYISLSL